MCATLPLMQSGLIKRLFSAGVFPRTEAEGVKGGGKGSASCKGGKRKSFVRAGTGPGSLSITLYMKIPSSLVL